jgi:hypothetical protein
VWREHPSKKYGIRSNAHSINNIKSDFLIRVQVAIPGLPGNIISAKVKKNKAQKPV